MALAIKTNKTVFVLLHQMFVFGFSYSVCKVQRQPNVPYKNCIWTCSREIKLCETVFCACSLILTNTLCERRKKKSTWYWLTICFPNCSWYLFICKATWSNLTVLIWIKSYFNTWSFCVWIICEHFNIHHSQMKWKVVCKTGDLHLI